MSKTTQFPFTLKPYLIAYMIAFFNHWPRIIIVFSSHCYILICKLQTSKTIRRKCILFCFTYVQNVSFPVLQSSRFSMCSAYFDNPYTPDKINVVVTTTFKYQLTCNPSNMKRQSEASPVIISNSLVPHRRHLVMNRFPEYSCRSDVSSTLH